jgi:hypothetical protein
MERRSAHKEITEKGDDALNFINLPGMKRLLPLFFSACLFLAGCDEGPPDQTTTIPFWLGTSHDSVRLLSGAPDRETVSYDGDSTESFFRHGYWVKYRNGRVFAISATEFVSGNKFSGKIFGLDLNSDLSDCEDRWGESVFEEEQLAHTLHRWYHNGVTIDVEVFNESGNWATSDGGYEKGAFRNITVTQGKVTQEQR